MSITIKTLTGKKCTIDCKLSDKIANIKAKISDTSASIGKKFKRNNPKQTPKDIIENPTFINEYILSS